MSDFTKPKPFCFVLMPFDEAFNDIYALGIKDACKEAGTYCERVDEQVFQERILDRIYNQIAKADIIIADMTGKNPNVFYEVGYAHALGKPTILVTQKAEDIPFDLKHFPHIVYNNKIVILKEDLKKRIEIYLKMPFEKVQEKLGIDLFIKENNLSNNEIEFEAYGKDPYINFTFFNNSSETFPEGTLKVGIIGSSKLRKDWEADLITEINLPDGKMLLMLPYFDSVFPLAYFSAGVKLHYYQTNDVENVTVRLFTSAGTRDYFFRIKFIDPNR